MKHCSQMFLNVLIYKHSWQLLKPFGRPLCVYIASLFSIIYYNDTTDRGI